MICKTIRAICGVVGIVVLAVMLGYIGQPGGAVARSYRRDNGCALAGYPQYTYRDVDLPPTAPLYTVTAAQARTLRDGYLIFAFPHCPYCRNLLPVLAEIAQAEKIPVAYCQIDRYRDVYTYDAQTAAPLLTQPAGEGYADLLGWLGEYLPEYALYDPDKNVIPVGEKRIGAPTIFRIENGEPVSRWKLSDAGAAEDYPPNKYDAWDAATRKMVEDSLRNYLLPAIGDGESRSDLPCPRP